eukprot:SAG25_NODE_3543_length_1046_cov_1.824454_1_plen_79_part_00
MGTDEDDPGAMATAPLRRPRLPSLGSRRIANDLDQALGAAYGDGDGEAGVAATVARPLVPTRSQQDDEAEDRRALHKC